jgi:hypothetical protein
VQVQGARAREHMSRGARDVLVAGARVCGRLDLTRVRHWCVARNGFSLYEGWSLGSDTPFVWSKRQLITLI